MAGYVGEGGMTNVVGSDVYGVNEKGSLFEFLVGDVFVWV